MLHKKNSQVFTVSKKKDITRNIKKVRGARCHPDGVTPSQFWGDLSHREMSPARDFNHARRHPPAILTMRDVTLPAMSHPPASLHARCHPTCNFKRAMCHTRGSGDPPHV